MTFEVDAARELALADWGVAISHQAVAQTYDPATQQVTESIVTTELRAIPGPESAQPSHGTAGQHLTAERTFLVPEEDWPAIAAGSIHRLIVDAEAYDIVRTQASTAAGWIEVHVRRRG